MDRGFLFGDSIYEVIPTYDGKMVGFSAHIARMNAGLAATGIELEWSDDEWRELVETLVKENGGGNLGVYLQVSRGADTTRFHGFPDDVEPTVFGFVFVIPEPQVADKKLAKLGRMVTAQDLRWNRCDIKSTSLTGNVMLFQHGHKNSMIDTLLFDANDELTEASTSNAYIVSNGKVITPPLGQNILAGVTRHILLSILRKDGSIAVEERPVTRDEVNRADEVWISSSTKEIVPVVEIDGKAVGDGQVGDVWLAAQKLYSTGKFDF
ncbi:MAG: aminotransferase class IV [Woeseiaceae bacterium]